MKQRTVDFSKAVVWEYPGKYFAIFYTEEVELTNFGRNLSLRCLWSAKESDASNVVQKFLVFFKLYR